MALTIIKGQLEEELNRKKRAINAFSKEIEQSQIIGQLQTKKIKQNYYFYVLKNINGKKKLSYVGSVDKVKKSTLNEINDSFNRYQKLRKTLLELKEDEKKLERVVKIL